MTIKEFFESNEKLVIHCDTEEKAITLLKAFDKAGYRWSNYEKYIEANYWKVYEYNTCYSNEKRYADIKFYQNYNYKILEFKDIEF